MTTDEIPLPGRRRDGRYAGLAGYERQVGFDFRAALGTERVSVADVGKGERDETATGTVYDFVNRS